MSRQLGTIISGSLVDGLDMRISPGAITSVKAGKFVSIEAAQSRFFSLVTDIALAVTNTDILLYPPSSEEQSLVSFLEEKDTYATATLKPMLALSYDGTPTPVKTIPPHFSPVYEATAHDIRTVFGDETQKDRRYFSLGSLPETDLNICLDLEKFTERSSGIFGKTGTGKTFLTRMILAGIIKQQKTVTLIFDMHSEYGLQARQEGSTQSFVKGLKTLFPERVAIFSLDPSSTRRRGGNPDVEIVLPYNDIQIEDILSLQDELNLHTTALEAAYLIAARHKQNWLRVLLQQGDNLKDFAADVGAHAESVAALYRKLRRIERLPFFCAEGSSKADSVIDRMLEYIDKDINIIIEFGNFTSTFVYLLVANIISRRLHTRYIEKTEKFIGSQEKGSEPKKLIITIEEAHKFLNPQAARQTIFGTIAREMRKYYVSLLIIDQRPSGIDPEVMSQVGTKIIAQLSDEKDVQAVLAGTGSSQGLRAILASLDSKKQALLIGHALAMPVVIQTRTYNEKFYQAMTALEDTTSTKKLVEEVFSSSP